MKVFETDKKYSCVDISHNNCVWTFEIIKRTDKRVCIEDPYTKEITPKEIVVNGDYEAIYPFCEYPMGQFLKASDTTIECPGCKDKNNEILRLESELRQYKALIKRNYGDIINFRNRLLAGRAGVQQKRTKP